MATDYSDWKQRRLGVASLLLDHLNPRIPGGSGHLSQRELIAELIEHDNVLVLAKDIAAKGFFPTEALVAIFDSDLDRHIVVEGNRRLAALKLLLSPTAAPQKNHSKLKKLAQQVDRSEISPVRVVVAPSRDDALPLIVDRHTHRQVESWSPAMQANFFRQQVEKGYTPAQIAALAGVQLSKVEGALRTDALYRAACALDLKEEVKAKVTNPRTFKLSTLERALDFPTVRDFLGIEIHPDKLFVGKIKREEFLKGFKRLVSDIAARHATSRKNLEDAGSAKKYLARFGDDTPDRSKRGRFSILDLASGKAPAKNRQPGKETSRRKPAVSRSVIPNGTRCSVSNARIQDVFKELKGLTLSKTPNASALLLRTLVDLCVTNYLTLTGDLGEAERRLRKKRKAKKPDWAPHLRELLIWIVDEKKVPLGGQALQALRRFTADRNEQLCLDSLDKFVHNPYTPPSEKDLRNIWTQIEPLMEVILKEP